MIVGRRFHRSYVYEIDNVVPSLRRIVDADDEFFLVGGGGNLEDEDVWVRSEREREVRWMESRPNVFLFNF